MKKYMKKYMKVIIPIILAITIISNIIVIWGFYVKSLGINIEKCLEGSPTRIIILIIGLIIFIVAESVAVFFIAKEEKKLSYKFNNIVYKREEKGWKRK